MTHEIHAWCYKPRITFQDTNVVGNVYFLTFFRWQQECRDHWLRETRPDLWKLIRSGRKHLQITHWETQFVDPFGATIGDDVEVAVNVDDCSSEEFSLTTDVFRFNGDERARIASGAMSCRLDGNLTPPHNDHPAGLCYATVSNVAFDHEVTALDLLGWQGKCRELFLADHAADTLTRVAQRDLILQTTSASLDMLRLSPQSLDQVRIEMRLETLKCGQMGVRFDYFAEQPHGQSIRIAKGTQKMSSKHQSGLAVVPCPFQADLLLALGKFTQSELLLGKIDDILSFSSAQQADVAATLSPVNE